MASELIDTSRRIEPELPLCPYDGAKLTSMKREVNRPSVYKHADGSEHGDLLGGLPPALPPAVD